MSKRGQKRTDAVTAIRERLEGMVTGCLPAETDGGGIRVYVMGGEVLAAHGPFDGLVTVRRLVNSGALTENQGRKLLEASGEASATELVAGKVPDDLLNDILHSRFRQNILDFLDLTPGTFEEMDAVFVDNLQIGHDSRALLDELLDLRQRISPLRTAADELQVRPGTWVPASQDEARLLDLCDPAIRLSELLDVSPWEPYRTLELVTAMLDAGTVTSENIQSASAPSPNDFADQATEEVLATDTDSAEDTLDVWLDEVLDGKKRRRRKKAKAQAAVDGTAPEDPALSSGSAGVVGSEDAAAEALAADTPTVEMIPTSPIPVEVTSWDGDTLVDRPAPVLPATTAQGTPPQGTAQQGTPQQGTPPQGTPQPLPPPEEVDDEPSGVHRFHKEVTNALEIGDEMSMFADHDQTRGAGSDDGAFLGEVLDRVELVTKGVEAADDMAEVIEVGEAEDIDGSAPVSTVSLSFTGPEMVQSDTVHKIHVCNDVLVQVAGAMDSHKGPGAGRACIQLLVDGTPHDFAPLFIGIEVDLQGRVDVDRVMKNLGKRPQGEHRRLVNRGVRDLIERALSSTFEELGDEAVEDVMAQIAGYEKRLGL